MLYQHIGADLLLVGIFGQSVLSQDLGKSCTVSSFRLFESILNILVFDVFAVFFFKDVFDSHLQQDLLSCTIVFHLIVKFIDSNRVSFHGHDVLAF